MHRLRRILGYLVLVAVVLVGGVIAWAFTHPAAAPLSLTACPALPEGRPTLARWPLNTEVGGATDKHDGRGPLHPLPFDLTPAEREALDGLHAGNEAAPSYPVLARAAAVASGLSSATDIAAFVRTADSRWSEMEPEITGSNEHEKAQTLLVALHHHVFRAPDPKQPSPAMVLEDGVFNCVSSAIIYNLYASRLGLKTSAVAEPNHAYSMVIVDGLPMAVSTTSIDGFGRELAFSESIGFTSGVQDKGREKITTSTLLRLAIEDRLALAQDDAIRTGSNDNLESLAAQAALWQRMKLIDPSDHDAATGFVALLWRLSNRLNQAGRAEESYSVALRAMQETWADSPPSRFADARNDLALTTTHLMDVFVKRQRAADAVAVLREAREASVCRAKDCGSQAVDGHPLDGDAMAALDTAVRDAMTHGSDDTTVWTLANGLIDVGPDADAEQTLTAVARYESDRLATAFGVDCADAFLAALYTHLACEERQRPACSSAARWGATHLVLRSPTRAAWWSAEWLRRSSLPVAAGDGASHVPAEAAAQGP